MPSGCHNASTTTMNNNITIIWSNETLTQSDLVLKNPGIYLNSIATMIGKSAKKQFPAYMGEFWSMSERLLEIYS